MNNALLIILVKLWKLIVFLPLKFQNLIAVILGYLISSIPIKRNRISKVNIDLCFKDLSQIERFKIYDKNKKAFAKVNMILTWKGSDLDEKGIDQNGNIRVDINPKYFRPNEVDFLLGDPSKAENELGWKREYTFDGLIDDMLSK